jgi:heme-degrading monooxygenase HmoA
MKRRTYLKTMLAGAAATTAATAQTPPRPIVLHLDMSVDPKREKEMLRNYEQHFKPTVSKQPGFLDIKILRLRTTIAGKAPAGVNYRFQLTFQSEELRQKWIKTDEHQRVWPLLENTLTTKDYTVLLFDAY